MKRGMPLTPSHRLTAFIAVALALGLSACTPPEPYRIGFIGGLSGRVADLGIDGRNGAILAVDLRNKAGGIKGRQVELLIGDDEQNPEIAAKAINTLIERKVEAIIGPMTSGMAMATVPLANKAQIVMMSPTATTNDLSGLDDYFFRVTSPTRKHAEKSAEHHLRHAGVRRVAAVYDLRNKSYTESWLNDYTKAFTAGGGTLIKNVSFSSSDETHFTDLARQLLSDKPDGILIIANSVDAAMISLQIRKNNPSILIVASEWAATERLIELGGRAVENIVIAQFLDRESSEPAYIEFRKHYVARYGKEPGFAGLTAFDSTHVVFEALENQTAGHTLKQTLLTRKTFAGLQSPIVFDAFGDTLRGTFITTIKNGSYVSIR